MCAAFGRTTRGISGGQSGRLSSLLCTRSKVGRPADKAAEVLREFAVLTEVQPEVLWTGLAVSGAACGGGRVVIESGRFLPRECGLAARTLEPKGSVCCSVRGKWLAAAQSVPHCKISIDPARILSQGTRIIVSLRHYLTLGLFHISGCSIVWSSVWGTIPGSSSYQKNVLVCWEIVIRDAKSPRGQSPGQVLKFHGLLT